MIQRERLTPPAINEANVRSSNRAYRDRSRPASVDDEQPNIDVFEALCSVDFSVLTASSAARALEVMREHEVGVVLSDQRMPHTTGVELLEQIRSEFPEAVRMLVTAYADHGATIEAINRGHVRRYIRKPWDGEELKAALAEALSLYETRRGAFACSSAVSLETERVYGLGVVASSVAQGLRAPVAAVSEQIKVARETLRFVFDSTPPSSPEMRPIRTRVGRADDALVDAMTAGDAMMSVVRGASRCRTNTRDEGVVDLNHLERLTLRILGSELRATAALQLELNPVPNVQGSSGKLGQVVINLMVNAMRAVVDRPRNERRVAVRLSTDGFMEFVLHGRRQPHDPADRRPGSRVRPALREGALRGDRTRPRHLEEDRRRKPEVEWRRRPAPPTTPCFAWSCRPSSANRERQSRRSSGGRRPPHS